MNKYKISTKFNLNGKNTDNNISAAIESDKIL